jgi:hypothetical protein
MPLTIRIGKAMNMEQVRRPAGETTFIHKLSGERLEM